MRLTLLTLLISVGIALYAQQQPKVMTLQECVDLAVENNLNVQRARLNLETAKINKKQADFQRLPNMNSSSSFGYNWGLFIDRTTNELINQRNETFTLGANSGLILFNGRTIQNSIKQSAFDVDASEYDVQKSSNDVQLDVVTFYLNVIFNKELLDNARFQLESSKEQLERTKKLVAAGALPRTNELELQSQVSTNEVNLINAENNLNLSYLTLKQVMLLPVSESIDVSIPDLEIEDVVIDFGPEEVFTMAENTMPEISSVDSRVRSAEYNYKSLVGGYYPTLSLNAGANTIYSGTRVQPLLDQNGIPILDTQGNPLLETIPFGDQLNDNLNKSITLNLSVPIFNRFNQRSNVQRSKVSLQQASINALEQRNALRQTIETAFNDVQAASKSYRAAVRQVEALEETFRTLDKQFSNGAANATDLQVAQNNLYRAKSDLSRAKFDFIFKKKLLDFYQGKSIF